MESSWKIATYKWEKKKRLVIERRFNLKEEAVDISPYFEFGITGISYRKDGSPKANYNLNEDLEITENSVGVASYQDTYDENGNHIQYSYHDKNDNYVKNQWGFAIGRKGYDANGNYISRTTFDEKNVQINVREIMTNTKIHLASPATAKDSLEIKEKSVGYLLALQQLNPQLMKESMNPKLAKRSFRYDFKSKKEIIKEITHEQMLGFAESWNKSGMKFPTKPDNQVIILDIYNHIASVKLVSDNWVEYLHLVKTNDEWSIINLLWQYKNIDLH
jgi:hypothetical protein